MKKETYYCDVCKELQDKKIEKSNIPVIFTTEQTEGRSCSPYLDVNSLELCKNCWSKMLQGNFLYAHGAQGHNTYYFKDSERNLVIEECAKIADYQATICGRSMSRQTTATDIAFNIRKLINA